MKGRLANLRWRVAQRWKRCRRAWAYATARLSEDDAGWIRYECQLVEGFYPLEIFTREAVLERCQDRWGDHPALPSLVEPACQRVSSKWNGDGEAGSAAVDWAMDLVAEYAAQDGIQLLEAEDVA